MVKIFGKISLLQKILLNLGFLKRKIQIDQIINLILLITRKLMIFLIKTNNLLNNFSIIFNKVSKISNYNNNQEILNDLILIFF